MAALSVKKIVKGQVMPLSGIGVNASRVVISYGLPKTPPIRTRRLAVASVFEQITECFIAPVHEDADGQATYVLAMIDIPKIPTMLNQLREDPQ
jgi:hypothetical protein